MNQDMKDLAMVAAGVLLAKAVDIAWDAFVRKRREKRKTPGKPTKRSKRS